MTIHEEEGGECPECGETELEANTDVSGEMVCTFCGLVFDKSEENFPSGNPPKETSDDGTRISTASKGSGTGDHQLYESLPVNLERKLVHPTKLNHDPRTICPDPDSEPEITDQKWDEGFYWCECGERFGGDYDEALEHLERYIEL